MEVLSLCLPNVTNLKRYFQEDQLIAFVFMAQTTYCVDFRNAAFGGIKGHSLRTTAFQKKNIDMEVLSLCLPYVKRSF